MKPPEPTPAASNAGLRHGALASAGRALSAGSLLGEFEVVQVIGAGSATIVYAAIGRGHSAEVAIAEYMPAEIAQRNAAAEVAPTSSAEADVFARGLQAFINETSALAQCDHPSLVRVLGSWEAHATAYRVMPRYIGETLLDARRRMAEPPDEAALRTLLDALLGALEAFHQTGKFHGRVSPSNILLLADRRPLLLGPGAADRAIASERIDTLITSPEPSFAPVEQIIESADTPLPPSVDLYALAGVARYWISGQMPAPAFAARPTARRELLADTVQQLSLTWPRLHYGASLIDALDSALSIYPAERPQSVAEMRARLNSEPSPAHATVVPPRTAEPTFSDSMQSAVPPSSIAEAPQLDGASAPTPGADIVSTAGAASIDDQSSTPAEFASRRPNPPRVAIWTGAAALALLVIGAYALLPEYRIERVLGIFGISSGVGGSDTSLTSSATVVAAPASPIPAEAGKEASTATPTEPKPADAGTAKSMQAETAAAESQSNAAAPPSSAEVTLPKTDTAKKAKPAAVAKSPARGSPPKRVAQQNAASAPASPRAECGSRTDFALYRCMQLECGLRKWASHPQCERLRTTDSVD